jgi:hypothetical protein
MKDCIAIMCHGLFKRIAIPSLVLSLGCLAGGCGAKTGTDTPSSEVPEAVKNMKDVIKKQVAAQKGAMGKGQRPRSSGN